MAACWTPRQALWEICEQVHVNIVDLSTTPLNGASLQAFTDASLSELQSSGVQVRPRSPCARRVLTTRTHHTRTVGRPAAARLHDGRLACQAPQVRLLRCAALSALIAMPLLCVRGRYQCQMNSQTLRNLQQLIVHKNFAYMLTYSRVQRPDTTVVDFLS